MAWADQGPIPRTVTSAALSTSFNSNRVRRSLVTAPDLRSSQGTDLKVFPELLSHSSFVTSGVGEGVKSKLPVVTNRVSIPGKDFKAKRSLMVQFFLHRYHHDFLAFSGKGKVQMAVESKWFTLSVGCSDHHIERKPRRASRASAAGRNQIVAARAATIKS